MNIWKKARVVSGLSQEQMAARLGRTKTMVSHYETGRAPMPTELMRAWFDACDDDGRELLDKSLAGAVFHAER